MKNFSVIYAVLYCFIHKFTKLMAADAILSIQTNLKCAEQNDNVIFSFVDEKESVFNVDSIYLSEKDIKNKVSFSTKGLIHVSRVNASDLKQQEKAFLHMQKLLGTNSYYEKLKRYDCLLKTTTKLSETSFTYEYYFKELNLTACTLIELTIQEVNRVHAYCIVILSTNTMTCYDLEITNLIGRRKDFENDAFYLDLLSSPILTFCYSKTKAVNKFPLIKETVVLNIFSEKNKAITLTKKDSCFYSRPTDPLFCLLPYTILNPEAITLWEVISIERGSGHYQTHQSIENEGIGVWIIVTEIDESVKNFVDHKNQFSLSYVVVNMRPFLININKGTETLNLSSSSTTSSKSNLNFPLTLQKLALSFQTLPLTIDYKSGVITLSKLETTVNSVDTQLPPFFNLDSFVQSELIRDLEIFLSRLNSFQLISTLSSSPWIINASAPINAERVNAIVKATMRLSLYQP